MLPHTCTSTDMHTKQNHQRERHDIAPSCVRAGPICVQTLIVGEGDEAGPGVLLTFILRRVIKGQTSGSFTQEWTQIRGNMIAGMMVYACSMSSTLGSLMHLSMARCLSLMHLFSSSHFIMSLILVIVVYPTAARFKMLLLSSACCHYFMKALGLQMLRFAATRSKLLACHTRLF